MAELTGLGISPTEIQSPIESVKSPELLGELKENPVAAVSATLDSVLNESASISETGKQLEIAKPLTETPLQISKSSTENHPDETPIPPTKTLETSKSTENHPTETTGPPGEKSVLEMLGPPTEALNPPAKTLETFKSPTENHSPETPKLPDENSFLETSKSCTENHPIKTPQSPIENHNFFGTPNPPPDVPSTPEEASEPPSENHEINTAHTENIKNQMLSSDASLTIPLETEAISSENCAASLSPIPENSPPSTAPNFSNERVNPTSVPTAKLPPKIPRESEISAGNPPTSGSCENPIDPPGVDKASPTEQIKSPEPETEIFSQIPDDVSIKTPATPSSERLSVFTAQDTSTPLGSTNEEFLSTKASNENTAVPKNEPDPCKHSPLEMVSMTLQKVLLNPELGEEAKAISVELLKNNNEISREGSEILNTGVIQTNVIGSELKKISSISLIKTEEIKVPVRAEDIIKEFSEDTLAIGSGNIEMVQPKNPVVPPIFIETSNVKNDGGETGIDVQEKKEDLKPILDKEILPSIPDAVVPVDVEAAKTKPENPIKSDKEIVVSEGFPGKFKGPILDEAPKEKPTTEIPIRQRDRSKEAKMKQDSKTMEKSGKPSGGSQVPASTEKTSIAATNSASATSALSPRSEKSIKQIKSPRPVSARSARGFPMHGDLSSSNTVLGVMTSQLTGAQRVAAARAAAAGTGVRARKMSGVTTSSALLDDKRSPREKPSTLSTNSIVPAAASASTISNNAASVNAVQKRTSTLSESSQGHAAARRGATVPPGTEGHRAVGHGGPSHLGIHGSFQKLKSSNFGSLETTYSHIVKSFVDAKKEIQLKTKLACEMFAEIERLRHRASTEFGRDLPLTEKPLGLAEAVPRSTGASGEMFSAVGNRVVAATEALLKALVAQRTALLNETSQHHANLLAMCYEAAGDEGGAKVPALFSEKEFADQLSVRIGEITAAEHDRVAEVLHVLRTSLSDLDATKASIRDLRSQLELLNQENSNLNLSLADCTKELEESRTEFGKVTAKKVAAEKEAKLLRMKLKETETKTAAEEQKCKDLMNQVRTLEDKLRSKDTTQEQRIKEMERKLRERFTKENEELQHRLNEALKQKQLKESKLEATDSKLGSMTQLLERKTKDKERIEGELKAATEKLSRITMQRSAETVALTQERELLVGRLQTMLADEGSSDGHQLKEQLQALSDLLNERERIIEEKNAEIQQLKDSNKESGDLGFSKEEFVELQETLSKLASHNQMLEQELSKMVESAAKRDKAMGEQEKVLLIRDQLIALLQGSKHAVINATNPKDVAIQQKILDLQTTVERQTVRIKALEAQLAEAETHQDRLQNLRTRYERRIAELEHSLTELRGTHKSETLTKLRTLLQGNLGQ